MKLLAFVALGVAFGATQVQAATPNVVSAETRAIASRAVHVVVAQSEIKSNTVPSNIAVATGGGLIGGLLAASQDASRAKKAEAAITPLRDALTGFDSDALAEATTKAALAEVPWLQAAPVTMGKDSSLLGLSALLDSNPASQIALLDYSYDVSPDFSSVRVIVKVQFANKAALPTGKPEARLQPRNLAYQQSITSIVSLRVPGAEMDANAALWAANKAVPARNALKMAFGEIQKLLPRALALTPEEIKAMNGKDRAKTVAGGFSGRLQPSTGPETLLWSNGFITVQPLS